MTTKRKLQTVKPRIKMLNTSRLKTISLPRNPDAVERTRGRAWMERRAKWLRANPLCCMCQADGFVRVADEVDHIVPLVDGGADDESNYQSLCKDHHKTKTAAENSARGRAG